MAQNSQSMISTVLGSMSKQPGKSTSRRYCFFSDETHLHLSGYVNKQSFQYWRANNLQFVHEQVHALLMNEILCDAQFHKLESLDLIFLRRCYGHCKLKQVCQHK